MGLERLNGKPNPAVKRPVQGARGLAHTLQGTAAVNPATARFCEVLQCHLPR
jgi:hypothetical protein